METLQYVEKPQLTLKDYVRLLLYRKWWIIISALVVFSIFAYEVSMMPPVYEAHSLIMLEESSSEAVSVLGQPAMRDQWGVTYVDVTNEMEIMKSRSVAEAVVEALWNSEHRNNLYLLGTRVFVPKGEQPKRWLMKIVTFGTWEPKKRLPRQYLEPFTEETGQKFSGAVRGRLTVTNRRYTNLLEIRIKSKDPHEASLLANTVVDVFARKDREWSSARVLSLKRFLTDQIERKRKELNVAEDSLRAYQERELIFGLGEHASIYLNRLKSIESEFHSNQAEINIARHEKSYTENQLSEEEKILTDQLLNSINARLFALRSQIAQEEAELVRNASRYGEGHEAVAETRSTIESLKQKLNEETELLIAQGISVADPIEYRQTLIAGVLRLEGKIAAMEARSVELGKLVELYNSELEQLPGKQVQFIRLERDRSVLTDTYNLMRQKLEETRISEASEAGKVRIIDPALPPGGPIGPNVRRNLVVGLILGMGLGVGLVLIREHFDNTIKSPEDIERFRLTLLGSVPRIDSNSNGRYGRNQREAQGSPEEDGDKSRPEFRGRIIAHGDPKSPVSEAYRSIRTNIAYSAADKEVKSILISSPGPAEGKSTTAANLAITFAHLGRKTLLVDSDLRRPILHRIFGTSREPGLTHYLVGVEDKFEALVHKTEVENLSFVASGPIPPNPSELLASDRMGKLVARLEKKWDVIIFDSPPIVAVTDASMISKEIDEIALVIKSGTTDKGALLQALQGLQHISAPLGGIILNSVSRKMFYKSYYNYYHYYYYSEDGEKRHRSRLRRVADWIKKRA